MPVFDEVGNKKTPAGRRGALHIPRASASPRETGRVCPRNRATPRPLNRTGTPFALLSSHMNRVPRATYRLQFNAGFTFADARAIVPYLAELGISDIYASPILRARKGSA